MANPSNNSISNALKKERINNVISQPTVPPPPIPPPAAIVYQAVKPPPKPVVESFFWVEVDRVNFPNMVLPYIVKNNVKYLSIKMIEKEVLSKFLEINSPEVEMYGCLRSTTCTEAEVELFNDINENHCMGKFGDEKHTIQDGTVSLEDFMNFYEVVKRTCRTADGRILVGSKFATKNSSNPALRETIKSVSKPNYTNFAQPERHDATSRQDVNTGIRTNAQLTGSNGFEPQKELYKNGAYNPPMIYNKNYIHPSHNNNIQQHTALQHHQITNQTMPMMYLNQNHHNLIGSQHQNIIMQPQLQAPYLQQRLSNGQSISHQININPIPRAQMHSSNNTAPGSNTPSPTFLTDNCSQNFLPRHQNVGLRYPLMSNGFTQSNGVYNQPVMVTKCTNVAQTLQYQQRTVINDHNQTPFSLGQSAQPINNNNRQLTNGCDIPVQTTNINYHQNDTVQQILNPMQPTYSTTQINGQSNIASNTTYPALQPNRFVTQYFNPQSFQNNNNVPTVNSPNLLQTTTNSQGIVNPPVMSELSVLNPQIQTISSLAIAHSPILTNPGSTSRVESPVLNSEIESTEANYFDNSLTPQTETVPKNTVESSNQTPSLNEFLQIQQKNNDLTRSETIPKLEPATTADNENPHANGTTSSSSRRISSEETLCTIQTALCQMTEPPKKTINEPDIIIISDDEDTSNVTPTRESTNTPPVLANIKEEVCNRSVLIPNPGQLDDVTTSPPPFETMNVTPSHQLKLENTPISNERQEQESLVELTFSIAASSLKNLKVLKKLKGSSQGNSPVLSRSSSIDSVPSLATNLIQINQFVIPYATGPEYQATSNNKICTKYLPCPVLAKHGILPKEMGSNNKLLKGIFVSFCRATSEQVKQLKSAMITSLCDETFETETGLVCLSELLINYLDRPVFMKCIRDQNKLVINPQVLFSLRGGVILYKGKDEIIPYLQTDSKIQVLKSCVNNLLSELNEEVESEPIEPASQPLIRRFFELMLFYFNFDSIRVNTKADTCLVDIGPLILKYSSLIVIKNEFTKNFPKDWNTFKKKAVLEDRQINNTVSSVTLSPSSIVSSSCISPVLFANKPDNQILRIKLADSGTAVIAERGSFFTSSICDTKMPRKLERKEVIESVMNYDEKLKKLIVSKPAKGKSRPKIYEILVNSLKRSISYNDILSLSEYDIDKINTRNERLSRSKSVECLSERYICSEEIIHGSKQIESRITTAVLRENYRWCPPSFYRNILKFSVLNPPHLKNKEFNRRYKSFRIRESRKKNISLLEVKQEKMEIDIDFGSTSDITTNTTTNVSTAEKIPEISRLSTESLKSVDSKSSKTSTSKQPKQTKTKRKEIITKQKPGKSKKYKLVDSSDDDSEFSLKLEITEQDEENYYKNQKSKQKRYVKPKTVKPNINMIRPDNFCDLYTTESLDEAALLRKFRDVKLISKCTVKMSDLKHSHLTESIKKALKDTSYRIQLSPNKKQTCKKQTNYKPNVTKHLNFQSVINLKNESCSPKSTKRCSSISSESTVSSGTWSTKAVYSKKKSNPLSKKTVSTLCSLSAQTSDSKKKNTLKNDVVSSLTENHNGKTKQKPYQLNIKNALKDSDDTSSDLPDLNL